MTMTMECLNCIGMLALLSCFSLIFFKSPWSQV